MNKINVGNINVSQCYLGDDDGVKLYLGDILVYPISGAPSMNYLYEAQKYNDSAYTYPCDASTSAITSTMARQCASSASLITGDTLSVGSPIGMSFGDCCTSLNNNVCSGWTHLSSLTFSDSVQTIGNSAFEKVKHLKRVKFGSGLTSIGEYAFYANHGSSDTDSYDVDLSKCSGLTSIGIWAFNWSGARKVKFPNSNLSIGAHAFESSHLLESVKFGNGNVIGASGFSNCYLLSAITFANQTSIPEKAFTNAQALSSLTIPSSVTSIGASAFASCTALTSITCLATTPPPLGNNAFSNTNDCPIYVPQASLSTYINDLYWDDYASRIQAIPNS